MKMERSKRDTRCDTDRIFFSFAFTYARKKGRFAKVLKFARHGSYLARHVSFAWAHVETLPSIDVDSLRGGESN